MEYIVAGRNGYTKVDPSMPYCYALIDTHRDKLIASEDDFMTRRKELLTEFYFVEDDFNLLKAEVFPPVVLEFQGALDDFRKDPASLLNKIDFYLEDNVHCAFSIAKMIPV